MTPAEIQSRITAERERLVSEETRERELTANRAAPLEAGDDKALDAIEKQIDESRTQQLRIQERIEVLAIRAADEAETLRNAELDALAATAERAREAGEKLIRSDYAKLSKA